jgi:hypothetical protein
MRKHKKDKPQQKKETPRLSNAEIEMAWVDAWNDLYDLVGKRKNVRCLLPDGVVVDVEGGKGWIQASVYEGHQVTVESGYVLGHPGVILLRSK